MKKYNKGFSKINTLIAILIVVGLGLGVYFLSKKKDTPAVIVNDNQVQKSTCDSYQPDNWKNLVPVIRAAFSGPYKDELEQFGEISESSILKTVDITGDCTTEALVSLESGGAYVESFGIAMYGNGNVYVPKVKSPNGEIGYVRLGSGASIKNQVGGDLIPGIGFYTFTKEVNEDSSVKSCEASAYKWNKDAGIFAYNQELTTVWQNKECK